MAVTSGSIKSEHSIDYVNKGWGIRIDWEQLDNSYDIKVTVYFEFRQTWSDLYTSTDRTGTLTVNGVKKSFTMPAGSYPRGIRDLKLGEYTFSIGSAKTINISASLPVAWTLHGYWVTNFSASGTATLKSIMSKPNNPTNVSLSLSGTTLNLSWSHTATQEKPVSRFSIQRSENGGSWQSEGTTTSKSYSRTGTRGRSYKFRVRAENAAGNSDYVSSNEVRIPYLAPNAPTNVKVTRQSHTRFTVTWDISVTSDRPVSSFDVYRSVNGGSYTRIASGLSSSARSYNDDTVELGKTYSYYIKAINQDGSTDSSKTSGLTNPTGIPVYNGSSFVIRPVYVYNGSEWVHRPVYVYNGSQWVWRG